MRRADESPLAEAFTQRELEILGLLAEGLTNREIADRLYLSHETVKWHNKQLYRKLGVSNRTQAASKAQEHRLTQDREPVPARRILLRKHNLPTFPTPFIGRGRELDEIGGLLEGSRLLTLTGPPGTGKTRLALQVASQALGDFTDGVYLAELAPLQDQALVVDAFAKSLGVKETEGQPIVESLKDTLRNRSLLLLADNFEHVIEAAPVVAELLSRCPDLKVLVTSREALGLYGEQEYLVPPLALPERARLAAPASLARVEAISLFLQRAQAVKPRFRLTDQNAPTVAEICVRLDGLPLAIELAAARLSLLSPQMLLDQLETRLTAAGRRLHGQPARHETLSAAISWSYGLLDEPEKLLFARLSVFRGGWSIEAAKEICGSGLLFGMAVGLESLLRKNMLRQIESVRGDLRFDMLETIHAYARDQLDRAGEAAELRSRHAEYFAALVERLLPGSRGGPSQLRRLEQLEVERENIRHAFEWSMDDDQPILGMRIVGSLGHFWFRRGHYAEARHWTERALELDERLDTPAPIRAALLHTAGVVAHFSGQRDEGWRLHLEALDLYRRLGDNRETGWLLTYLGAQAIGQPSHYRQAVPHVEEGLDMLRGANDRAGTIQALHVIGELARHSSDHERALEAFTEGLSIAREIGDVLREIFILDSLSYMAIYENQVQEAAELCREAFALTLEADHRPHIPAALAAMAALATAEGHPEQGARLLGASNGIFETYGFTARPSDTPDIKRATSVVREALDPGSFEAAWAEGQAMSMEQAIDYALSGAPGSERSSR